MKQLEKLGLFGTKVLTNDQMKNVQGGNDLHGCSAGGPRKLCAAALCEVDFGNGMTRPGVCNSACICVTMVPDLP